MFVFLVRINQGYSSHSVIIKAIAIVYSYSYSLSIVIACIALNLLIYKVVNLSKYLKDPKYLAKRSTMAMDNYIRVVLEVTQS